MQYYNGTRLLQSKDLNKNKPEIYICTSNRSAGKTTFFAKYLVDHFLKYGHKFCLIYRFAYELADVAGKFFKDIQGLFFPDMEMVSETRAKGSYCELYLDDVPCGYAVCLNTADQLKKYSHLFSDTYHMFFDEFQSETNHYAPNELKKFISIHTSFARGNGQMVRYLPVYMCSNPVSLINPYYSELGIAERLRADTKFLRGDGFVLENGFNRDASKAQETSAFNRAFSKNQYVAYAAQSVYLNDNTAFIEPPTGRSHYVCTLNYQGKNYGILEYQDAGIVYCSDKADMSFKEKFAVTTEDHQMNYVMLKSHAVFMEILRFYFERGCFRFKTLKCKEVIMRALSY